MGKVARCIRYFSRFSENISRAETTLGIAPSKTLVVRMAIRDASRELTNLYINTCIEKALYDEIKENLNRYLEKLRKGEEIDLDELSRDLRGDLLRVRENMILHLEFD